MELWLSLFPTVFNAARRSIGARLHNDRTEIGAEVAPKFPLVLGYDTVSILPLSQHIHPPAGVGTAKNRRVPQFGRVECKARRHGTGFDYGAYTGDPASAQNHNFRTTIHVATGFWPKGWAPTPRTKPSFVPAPTRDTIFHDEQSIDTHDATIYVV